MGLLDDAIREHLDLKRRRGADPSEIAKDESEALGPIGLGASEESLDGEDDVADGSYADDAPAALDEPAVAYDDPFAEDEPPAFAAEPQSAADVPQLDDDLVPSEAPQTHTEPYAEPEDESATPPHGDPLAHQQTREFSATELGDALGEGPAAAAAEQAAPDEEGDEDVLEETPDFLQETPEHDRLWFEQKPPKDFDF
jgi:hypothetical protein